MPRGRRVRSSSDFYHVMCRGNNKEKVFNTREEKFFYRNVLNKLICEYEVQVYAWCIMSNHVHLFLKGNLSNISKLIHKLNTVYGQKYNDDHDRVGHIFQGRYKSEVVESKKYFFALIRYIHNNPVKAGVVSRCEDYKWSSYRDYIYKNGLISQHTYNIVMKYFDNDYSSFVKFHSKDDKIEFIDIEEEVEEKRRSIIQEEVRVYCLENDLLPSELDDRSKKEIAKKIVITYNYKIQFIGKELQLSYGKMKHLRDKISRERKVGSLGTVPNDPGSLGTVPRDPKNR